MVGGVHVAAEAELHLRMPSEDLRDRPAVSVVPGAGHDVVVALAGVIAIHLAGHAENRDMAQDHRAPKSTADFLVRLIDILTQRIEEVSLSFDDTVDQLETAVYDDGAQTLPNLSDTRRQVIKLRRFVGPQTDALLRLVTIDSPVIPARLQSHLRETANRATRSVEELAEVRERLTALSEHLDLAQSVRLRRNGYLLSVVAAIFLPLGLLTGLFGVNLGGLPGVGAAGAFWIFCGALVVIGILVFIILKLRNLL
ncbi:MAG: hypothetical protein EBT13_10370 [Rhodobacteraceae bacterium]|nr:hypothetical protein [Paracoccaceae bacterium]